MTVIRDTDYTPVQGVPLRGPLAMGGFFIHYLRIRFGESWSPPWIWRPNDTETDIFIISGGVIETEIRNNRPAIFVNVGTARAGDVVIGDRADTARLKVQEGSYSRVDMNMTINCESSNKGESHALGWCVFTALLAAKDVLRTKYQIANMGPFELIPPRPSKKDRETYISTINFAMAYELTWNVEAVQTVIKELDFTMDLQHEQDPTSFLTRIYVQSLDVTTQEELWPMNYHS